MTDRGGHTGTLTSLSASIRGHGRVRVAVSSEVVEIHRLSEELRRNEIAVPAAALIVATGGDHHCLQPIGRSPSSALHAAALAGKLHMPRIAEDLSPKSFPVVSPKNAERRLAKARRLLQQRPKYGRKVTR